MKRTPSAVIVVVVGLAIGLVAYFNYDVRYAIARLQRDTPEAPVEMYLEAVSRGNGAAAHAVWRVEAYKRDELDARRALVTRDLVARRPTSYRIEVVEWWSFCCEPHIIDSGRYASGARFTVALDGERYRFDVHAKVVEQIWDGLPARGWVLMDVYLVGQPAVWNTWPGR